MSDLTHHVLMAELKGQTLGMAQQALVQNIGEFGRVSLREAHEGSAHTDTQSIYLRSPPWPIEDVKAVHEDLRVVNWPVFQLDDRFYRLLTMMQETLQRPIARALIVRLKPGGMVKEHRDEGLYSQSTDRFHYAIETNPEALSIIGDEEVHMPLGTLWWYDKDALHSAVNRGPTPRTHLIFDCWRT